MEKRNKQTGRRKAMAERRKKKQFLDILKLAWVEGGQRFSKEQFYSYMEGLDYLQNTGESMDLNKEEILDIFMYIDKTVRIYTAYSIRKMKIETEIINSLQNLYFILEYLFVFHQEKISVDQPLELLYSIIGIEQYNFEKLEFLLRFYEESELLDKICFYLYYYFDFICRAQLLEKFLSKIDQTDHYRLFNIILYQINPAYIKQRDYIQVSECKPKELYYGICYGYYFNDHKIEVYKYLLKLCNIVKNQNKTGDSIDNPVVVFSRLFQDGYFNA
ncbi:MAG TPA: hypothetical protein PLU43_06555 [Lachnospiraceae bacterium]|nr:hypothetical protein [Lachnospiraceae bacterium]